MYCISIEHIVKLLPAVDKIYWAQLLQVLNNVQLTLSEADHRFDLLTKHI